MTMTLWEPIQHAALLDVLQDTVERAFEYRISIEAALDQEPGKPHIRRFRFRPTTPVDEDDQVLIARILEEVRGDIGREAMPLDVIVHRKTWLIGDGDDTGASGTTPDGWHWFWVRDFETPSEAK